MFWTKDIKCDDLFKMPCALPLHMAMVGLQYLFDLNTNIERRRDLRGAIRRKMRARRSGVQTLEYDVRDGGRRYMLQTGEDLSLLIFDEVENGRVIRRIDASRRSYIETNPFQEIILGADGWGDDDIGRQAGEFMTIAEQKIDEMRRPEEARNAVRPLPMPIADEIWQHYSQY